MGEPRRIMYQFLNTTSALPSVGAAFDPTTLTGYELHLIAGSLDGSLNDGDTLTSWPDETTTYNFDAISGTPTLEKNEVNGESIVRFLGASSERVRDISPLIDIGNKYTQVQVIKTPSTATQVYLHRASTAESYIIKRTTDDLKFYATNGVVTLQTTDFTPGVAAGNWWIIIWTVDFTSGSMAVYINNVSSDATASSSSDSTNPGDCYYNIPADALYPDLDVAEFLLYNNYILTSGEISSMLTYMGNKYLISVTT